MVILMLIDWFTSFPEVHFVLASMLLLPLCGYLNWFLDNIVDNPKLTNNSGLVSFVLYSCGNLPELILSSVALAHKEYRVTRENNVGAIFVT